MKKIIHIFVLFLSLITIHSAFAEEEITGRTKSSCEAILCLSTGSPPGECSPSLSEYYSINFDDFGDTLRERKNFLNLCPVSAQSPQMQSLVNAIVNGAGRCDAASLNATLASYTVGFGQGCIKDTKPSYCTAYEGHEYSDLGGGAHYVIDPPKKTYWPFGGSTGMGGLYSNNQQTETCGHWVD